MIHVMASIVVRPEHAAAAKGMLAAGIAAPMPLLVTPLAVHSFAEIA